jgi:hypothetical protein
MKDCTAQVHNLTFILQHNIRMDKSGSKNNANTQYNYAFHIHIFESQLLLS